MNSFRKDDRNTESLAASDHRHLWHPFTQQQSWCNEEPLILVSGSGALLTDSTGKSYLDGNSSIWTNIHGHSHPKIVEAVSLQIAALDHASFLGTTHPKAIELAERLVGLLPGTQLTRVFFSDNGSTAVEAAIKMALQYWQLRGQSRRHRFASFSGAYHGDTAGAASLGGIGSFFDRFAGMHFPTERFADLGELESFAHPEQLAAIIIEPLIQGSAGMRLWPEGMLRKLRKFCDRTGSLLILDEVMTGFGRTGSMFACQQEAVVPDLLCLAKGLTGGVLPLAATLVTEEIYNAFLGKPEEQKTFYYGHSYTANPTACAAALANLDLFVEEETLRHLQPKIAYLSMKLETLRSLPWVAEIRQCGFIVGIEVMKDPATLTPFPWHELTGATICKAARKHGLLTRPVLDTLVLMPPLCISLEQIDLAVTALRSAILEVCDAPRMPGQF
jgi:adenosylmethionine-8-amino-7-oxononanoate aminotransferase